ncbi:condensation domain-containing protein [Ditylenchus destructor]|uniref:Condensation domain-containing protein n=1 Tax=Ditylenchus destructor TaxID=166010 RepID=A0AAD4R9X0_9BILA|nr:condensation domain-containing protein [Ditylenchus destructor]
MNSASKSNSNATISITYHCETLKNVMSWKRPRIDLNDSFTRMGMDSLQLASFEYQIAKRFNSIPPGFCLQNYSPQMIIDRLSHLEHKTLPNNAVNKHTSVVKNSQTRIPLSRAQKRIWFVDAQSTGSSPIIEGFRIILSNIDLQRLLYAVNRVVLQNSILRTCFVKSGREQIIHSGTESYFFLSFTDVDMNPDVILPKLDSGEIPLRFKVESEVFTAAFHHILIDGKSIRIFVEQLLEALFWKPENGRSKNRTYQKQYVEFCIAEKAMIETSKYRENELKLLEYWLEKLRNWHSFPRLPRDPLYLERNSDCDEAKTMCLTIETHIGDALYELAAENGATMFTTFTAILRVLLYKMYGIRDLWLGVPVENRRIGSFEFQDCIGLFLNISVSRENLDPSDTFTGFLPHIITGMRDTLIHSQLSFDVLVANLRRQNTSENLTDLFEIAVIQDTSPEDEFCDYLMDSNNQSQGSKVKVRLAMEERLSGVQHPIMWHFIEQKSSRTVQLRVEYNSSLFHSSIIHTMTNKFKLLCEKITSHPGVLIRDLTLMEKQELLKEPTTADFPQHCTPIDVILAQLKMLPCDTTIVQDAFTKLSAAEIMKKTSSLAHVIDQRLFREYGGLSNVDQPIALLLQRNVKLIICILAIWRTGRAVLPISYDWPSARIIDALNSFDRVVLITDKKLSDGFPTNFHVDDLLAEAHLYEHYPFQRLFHTTPHDLLYLTFTSGTTGRPKSVATEGIGLLNLIYSYTILFGINSSSVVYQVVNYAFDIFFADILMALMNGARLILARDAIPCLEELREATHAYIMPAYLSRMTGVSNPLIKCLSHLHIVLYGGEPVNPEWLRLAIDAKVRLVQLFGFTEHSVYSAYQRMISQTLAVENRLNIGHPFPNVSIYAVDEDGRTLPTSAIGAEGNLRSSGVGLMRGYVDNYTNSAPKYFESGDRVRILPSSQLRFVGRRDSQVKVHGHRVELLDVESALSQVPGVQICIVECIGNGDCLSLVAFIILDETIKEIESSVNSLGWLQSTLGNLCPSHMIPDKFFQVEEFPLNSNGKIDRRALLRSIAMAPVENQIRSQSESGTKACQVDNTNFKARKICEIFGECMKGIKLEPSDNIFEKGADSLGIMMALQRVEQETGLEISVHDVFRHKTIVQVLESIEETDGSKTKARLSSALETLKNVLNDELKSSESFQKQLEFDGSPDIGKLQRAINCVLQRHSALKTMISIDESTGQPYQVMCSGTESFISISKRTEVDINVARSGGITLANSPEIPVQAQFIERLNGIRLTFEHWAVDGISLQLVANEMAQMYSRFCTGFSPSDFPKVVSSSNIYAQFAFSQRSQDFSSELEYWAKELENVKNGLEVFDGQQLGPNFSKNDIASHYVCNMDISRQKWDTLLANHSFTSAQILAAAYALCLSKEYTLDTVVIGIPFSGRSSATADFVGYFANALAVKFSPKLHSSSNLEWLVHVRNQLLEAARHAQAPFPLVVRRLAPKRKHGQHPLFQRMFVFEDDSEGNETNGIKSIRFGPKLTATVKHVKPNHAKFDQCWTATVKRDSKQNTVQVVLDVEYKSSLFKAETIKQSAKMFQQILYGFLDDTIEMANLLETILPHTQNLPLKRHKVEKIQTIANYAINLENKILAIWKEVLDIGELSVDDNFFDVGDPQSHNGNIPNPTAFVSTPEENEKVEVCYLQTQLLRLYKKSFEVGSLDELGAYTIQLHIQLSENIDIKRLRSCIRHLIASQPVLRTVFSYDESSEKFMQRCLPVNSEICKGVLKEFDDIPDNEWPPIFDPFATPPVVIQVGPKQTLRFAVSHLIFDGTSINILRQQLTSFYSDDTSLNSIPLHVSYAKFSNDFNAVCEKQNIDNRTFWLGQLQGMLENGPINCLVTDYSRPPPTQPGLWQGAKYSFFVSGLNSEIGKASAHFEITPLALMAYALGQIVRQRMSDFWAEFCIATCRDMRHTLESNETIGFFVNTLIIPLRASKGKLQQATQRNLKEFQNLVDSIVAHSHICYDQILNLSNQDSLFEVMLVIDSGPSLNQSTQAYFQVIDTPVTNFATKFPITVFVSMNGKDANIQIEYQTALLHEGSIKAILDGWIQLMRKISGESETGRHSEVQNSEINETDFPSRKDVWDIIREQALLCPDFVAIQTPRVEMDITYATFVDLVDHLADRMQDRYFAVIGRILGPDSIIAILGTRNSAESILLCLAVMRACGAYLPIDIESNPPARVIAILEEASVNFYISKMDFVIKKIVFEPVSPYRDIITNYRRKDEENSKFKENIIDARYKCRNKPEDLAYVIFTSGTTGRPKGVAIQRIGLVNMICEASKQLYAKPGECVYQFTNFCFDNSVLEIFLALFNGMRLFIDDPGQEKSQMSDSEHIPRYFSADRFFQHLEEFPITHVFFFPALVETFEDHQLKALSKLKYWTVGAEKISNNLLQRALKFGVRVVQNYGPTECTCFMLRKRMKAADHPQNLGQPIANMFVSVRTPTGDIAIPYAPHELYVGGVGLTRGYLNRSLEEQPFVYFDERRYYATGDIVQRLPNGDIQFVGRKDSQIKVRGFRIEIGEIESVLMQFPEVRLAKVVAEDERKDLLAYIIPFNSTNPPSVAELRRLCRQRLAHFMVPRSFTILDSIPLTPNAKIDLSKISERDIEDNLDESFVYLGGNSLSSQRLINQIQDYFSGVDLGLTMKDLLGPNATLRQFLAKIQGKLSSSEDYLLNLRPNFNELESSHFIKLDYKKLPLSYQQEQMYYLSHLSNRESRAYIVPLIQQFSADLDVNLLHHAFMDTMQEHRILRTKIRESEDFDLFQEALSVTETYFAPNVEVCDSEEILREKLFEFCEQNLDLLNEPPVLCRIFKLSEEKGYMLALLVHHIAIDATSTQILERNIAMRYKELRSAEMVKVQHRDRPKTNASYALWAIRQKRPEFQEWMGGKLDEMSERTGPMLSKRLAIGAIFLNSETQNSPTSSNNLVAELFRISAEAIKSSEVTPYAFFLTALIRTVAKGFLRSVLLEKNPGDFCMIIGSPFHNRSSGFEQVLGNFLTNMILALPLHKISQTSVNGSLQIVQSEIDVSREFAQIPYSKLFEGLRKFVGRGENLFDIYLNCRYGLEDETVSGLSKMPEAVLDRNCSRQIFGDFRWATHFMEISVDQHENYHEVEVVVGKRSDNRSFDEEIAREFIQKLKAECNEMATICKENVSKILKSAIISTLDSENGAQISENDNFFHIGGNSFLLLKLRRKLEIAFGIHLDLGELANRPIIEEMVKYIEWLVLMKHSNEVKEESLSNSGKSVDLATIIMQANDPVQEFSMTDENKSADILLVFFHALVGGNLCYSALHKSINNLAASYGNILAIGIQHPNTFQKANGKSSPSNFGTFTELCQYYANFLEKFVKRNRERITENTRITFVGASIGAALAYECGVGLEDSIKVDVIISIDGIASELPEITFANHRNQTLSIISRHAGISETSDAKVIDAIIENSWQLLSMRKAHRFSTAKRSPRILLLEAKENESEINDTHHYDWPKLNVDLVVEHIPGNHLTMLDPENTDTLAQKILQFSGQICK